MRNGALWPIYSGAMGSVCVLTRYNYCGNHSYCDCWGALAFRRNQLHNNIDRCIGCHVGLCSCVTRRTQINGCTGLVPEVLCMFRHQLCIEHDIIAAFLFHQGYPLLQGLIVVMTLLVTIVVFHLDALGIQRWWQSKLIWFVTYRVSSIIASCDWQRGQPDSALQLLVLYAHDDVSIYLIYTLWKRIGSFNEYYHIFVLNVVVTTLSS